MANKICSTRALNTIIAFFGLVLCARALTLNLDKEWKLFKDTYKKKYDTKEEESKRRQIFEDNAKFIAMHNIQENMEMHSFRLGINDKTDMSDEEFQTWSSCYKDNHTLEVKVAEIENKKLCGDQSKNKADEDESENKTDDGKSKYKCPEDKCKPPEDKSKDNPPEDKQLLVKETPTSLDYGEINTTNQTDKDKPKPKTDENKSKNKTDKKLKPENQMTGDQLDYRKKGMVSPVMDQGDCNACYAFSGLGSLEAQMMKKTGKLVPLSEQNIIDCSDVQGNHGCYTGHIFSTYLYVLDNKGVNSLAKYPFVQKNGTCNFQKDDIAGTITSIQSLSKGEGSILTALKTVGPISAAMVGNTKLFQNYKSGIFEDPNCKGDFSLSILIVGYGTDEGKDYWLIKNSRGTAWGEKGYFRIARGKNMCRIGERGSYPKI